MHNFTPNDVLLYISGEMPLIESKAIEHAMLIDAKLFNHYYEMLNLWQDVQHLDMQPSVGFADRLMDKLGSDKLVVAY
jgi:hypothetical protein